jgi:hypothetical protein
VRHSSFSGSIEEVALDKHGKDVDTAGDHSAEPADRSNKFSDHSSKHDGSEVPHLAALEA